MKPISYRIGYHRETKYKLSLRFIHNWVIMGIQWTVRWWLLVYCGCPHCHCLRVLPEGLVTWPVMFQVVILAWCFLLLTSNFFTSFFQRKLEILKKKKVEKLGFANKSLLDNMPSRYTRKFMPVLYTGCTHLFRKVICRSICGTFIWRNW